MQCAIRLSEFARLYLTDSLSLSSSAGCLLHIQFEGESALHPLGSLDSHPENAAKTFELTLTLRQGQDTWGQRVARWGLVVCFCRSFFILARTYKRYLKACDYLARLLNKHFFHPFPGAYPCPVRCRCPWAPRTSWSRGGSTGTTEARRREDWGSTSARPPIWKQETTTATTRTRTN